MEHWQPFLGHQFPANPQSPVALFIQRLLLDPSTMIASEIIRSIVDDTACVAERTGSYTCREGHGEAVFQPHRTAEDRVGRHTHL